MNAEKKHFIYIAVCCCLLVTPGVLCAYAGGATATVEITGRVLLTAFNVDATDITNTNANITWMTNGLANSTVYYGTDTAYGNSETEPVELVTSHRIPLKNLILGTTYHYRVVSSDSAGTTCTSPDLTFTTPGGKGIESSITLTPGSAGNLVSPDGRYSVSFPQGSVLGDVMVTLKPYSRDKLQPAPADAMLGVTSFEISGVSGLLYKDATVRVSYSADDLSAAGSDPSKMKLSYYDTAKNSWTILPTQMNTQNMTLTTTTNHLSVWAVMISSSAATPVPTKAPLPAIINLGSLLVAAIISCCIARHRK